MSFSVSLLGRPEAIKDNLFKESERLTGQSKEEFDAIAPALTMILDHIVNPQGVVHLSVHGHAAFADGVKTFGQCNVEIKVINGICVNDKSATA